MISNIIRFFKGIKLIPLAHQKRIFIAPFIGIAFYQPTALLIGHLDTPVLFPYLTLNWVRASVSSSSDLIGFSK